MFLSSADRSLSQKNSLMSAGQFRLTSYSVFVVPIGSRTLLPNAEAASAAAVFA